MLSNQVLKKQPIYEKTAIYEAINEENSLSTQKK